MAKENVRGFLEYMKTNPEAKERLGDLTKPEGEEAIISYYAEAAKRLSYDVTEDDLRQTLAGITAEQADRTEKAAESIQELLDDELEKAAGGYIVIDPNCKNETYYEKYYACCDTYEDRENCWSHDGCDRNINMYPDYRCQHNYAYHTCGNKESCDCSEFLF